MRKSYGLQLVVGEFGAGKTFFTHADITGFGTHKTIRIGNYTSPDFHLEFRSVADLVKILEAIYNYKKDPRNLKTKIVIVLDEASLYFNSRDFKTFPKEMLSFLVQLRKLNVHMFAIVQSLKMLDVNFRRLCYYVRDYRKGISIIRLAKTFELLSEDANLNDPLNTKLIGTSILFHPAIVIYFRKLLSLVYSKLEIYMGSSKYDTNELVLPHFSVLDKDRLNKLFPYTYKIDDQTQYLSFINQKRDMMLSKVLGTVKDYYARIDGKEQSGDAPPSATP